MKKQPVGPLAKPRTAQGPPGEQKPGKIFSMRSAAKYDLTNLRIEYAASTLRIAGALDVDGYERKLRQNAPNHVQVTNHLSEARVALMFLENGAQVTMRDSPDLKVEWCGESFYAEVKHFRRTQQDELDEVALRTANGEFIAVGDPVRRYKEMCAVARKKKEQYIADALNILVIDSSSDAILPADDMARSAVNEYDEEVRKTPQDLALQRLNGIMPITAWGSDGLNLRNVAFAFTRHALLWPKHLRFFGALNSIGRGPSSL